ncbi:MAG: SCO family protein [Deltaproteobacteria bacterium]|nr:SCO family protein [Deltaproteobacteria bacterium]
MRKHATVALALAAVLLAVLPDGSATAAPPAAPPRGILSAPEAMGRPPELSDVAYDQKLGDPLPLDLPFRDSSGKDVVLGGYFGSRPVVLLLAYYGCPMLCPLSIDGLAKALKPLSLDVGSDFDVVVASFDPADGAEDAKRLREAALSKYGRDGTDDGWHFLTGDADAIRELTSAVGYRYARDEKTGEFAHPSGVVVATADGKISRYLFGIDPAPRDLRLALIESSDGKIGTPVDQVLLFCFRYDPAHGRYSAATLGAVRVAGAATAASLALFIGAALWRERRRRGDIGDRP